MVTEKLTRLRFYCEMHISVHGGVVLPDKTVRYVGCNSVEIDSDYSRRKRIRAVGGNVVETTAVGKDIRAASGS